MSNESPDVEVEVNVDESETTEAPSEPDTSGDEKATAEV